MSSPRGMKSKGGGFKQKERQASQIVCNLSKGGHKAKREIE